VPCLVTLKTARMRENETKGARMTLNNEKKKKFFAPHQLHGFKFGCKLGAVDVKY